ncbi:PREDICTED: TIR domain-containing adapter molecule 1 [Tinamus guttatus]|uniref:TIR domain-containing adapter molecule 1 n=1 Tax=Tinamus guttatus TaxID=94827 RepID=UPI00052EBBC8|nr:PREDICTED: TIR domain-containing adapter molecule 1 [Tinamus guttatus]
MTPSTEVQPSFEDVFNILSRIPEDKLLNLKYKLKHLMFKPCSKLLQAMVLLTLRREADARICLDALRDEQAARYVHRTRLGPAGAQENGEDPQPPELDAEAMVLLARIYSLLADENLCGREAVVRAYRRVIEACGASRDPQQEPLRSILAEAQEKCGAALGFVGSGSRFQPLRSDLALRVKGLLEAMGVPDGATFSGDFLTGGRGQLSCFQDAMENSAFTILLLTKNFLCQPCMFQTNSALMQSIETPSKYNSVIPFVPRENPLEDSEIPFFLRGLVPLNENSPMFSTRVRNTFTRSKVSEQKALWKQRQQVQEQQRKLQLYQEHWRILRRLSELNLGSLPRAPWPSEPGDAQQVLEQLQALWSAPQCPFPTSAQPGPSPSHTFFQPRGMPAAGSGQHLIIIQNAKMVQIGDHNVMRVRTAPPAPEDGEEDGEKP